MVLFRIRSLIDILVSGSLVMANKLGCFYANTDCIRYFLKCYFNDLFGNICLLSVIGLALSFFNGKIPVKLFHLMLFTGLCGIFWEYVTPIYRPDTTSDVFDIIAYMVGGLFYWFLFGGRDFARVEDSYNK